MRRPYDDQLPLLPQSRECKQLRELQRLREILDAIPKIAELVYADLTRDVSPGKGSNGLSGDQVFCAMVLKQQNGYTYEELDFHLNTNGTYRWLCRLPPTQTVSGSALNRDILKISPKTKEECNRLIVAYARDKGIEKGRKVRTDCTGVETTIHKPTDSLLLWECIRVLSRLLKEAKRQYPEILFKNHTSVAKRDTFAIENAKNQKQRLPGYKKLLKTAGKVVGYAERGSEILKQDASRNPWAESRASEIDRIVEFAHKVIDQTRRRVIDGETVPASEKVFSIFEPHTDIIVKDNKKDPLYGHKICLTAGDSGVVIDCKILDGNPADATLTVEMMKRVKEIYGRPPRQAALDGAFRSKANLKAAKEEVGIKDVAFTKGGGFKITDMVKSAWVYKKLRNFRAGVESIISFLKRAIGLSRCTWRGLRSFKSYVWSSVVSANLLTIARHGLN